MSYGNRGRGRGGAHGQYNNRANFNQQNVDDFVVANAIPMEILGWNGATAEECISFISRKCRIVVFNHSVDNATGILKGYVKTNKDANELLNWSGVKFAGQSLKFSKSSSVDSLSNQMGTATPGASNNTIDVITQFLKTRYQPQTKMLNLATVKQDPGLVAQGFFAKLSTSSKFFPALMKVAKDLKLDVDSVDLSGNELSDLSTISSMAYTFPSLKNLSLANNNFGKIKVFEAWKHKLNFVRELIISGNPLVNITNPQDILNVKLELMKTFPRLIVLNGEVLRNERALLANLKFSFDSPTSMFFQDDEIQNLATNFVSNYIKLWDSNRADLMILYQNESQFSMQVDTAHPHVILNSSYSNGDFGNYIPNSRNLCRVSTAKLRMSRLAVGQEQIFKAFSQLPKTRHDLINKPHQYSMESYRVPQLNGFMISLHGSFEEIAPPDNTDAVNSQPLGPRRYNTHNKNKKVALEARSFDRNMIVIPGPNGSMIVASDLLSIRPYTEPDAWTAVQPNPNTNPHTPVPGSSPAPAPPNQPSAADLPPDVKAKLNPIQQDLLVKIVLETKLNLQYGYMLCEQSNWDYQQCIINFKNSAASLPPDAYA